MVDLTVDLNSFSFESSLGDDEKEFEVFRARSNQLTICGCAHAAFLCRLSLSLRYVTAVVKGLTKSAGTPFYSLAFYFFFSISERMPNIMRQAATGTTCLYASGSSD